MERCKLVFDNGKEIICYVTNINLSPDTKNLVDITIAAEDHEFWFDLLWHNNMDFYYRIQKMGE